MKGSVYYGDRVVANDINICGSGSSGVVFSRKKNDATLKQTAVEIKGDEISNIKGLISVWQELVIGLRAEIVSLKDHSKETIEKLMNRVLEMNETISKLTIENSVLRKEIGELKDLISNKFK